MECYGSFDPGFFDRIIADESHRSIYNRYRELFAYFDALQVGLTATPVEFIARNTYTIFGCEDRDPTAYFSFEDAINHTPPYLVPFEVVSHTTPFLRKTGESRDSPSRVVSGRGCSSRATSDVPFLVLISTGTISAVK